MKISHFRLTDDLRKGRITLPHARYFITCASKRPQYRMIEPRPALAIKNAIEHLEKCGDVNLLCGTIMPDHVHLLLVLKEKLSIGQIIGKFKTMTKICLSQYGIHWQRNYFEHRLRADDLASDYARYIFMNPYRSNLVSRESEWPHWLKNSEINFNFMAYLEQGRFPPKAWVKASLEDFGINPQCMGND